jgi:hypothetical protein
MQTITYDNYDSLYRLSKSTFKYFLVLLSTFKYLKIAQDGGKHSISMSWTCIK